MGIKDKEFREGDTKFLQKAFGRRAAGGGSIITNANEKKNFIFGLRPFHKVKRSKSSDMLLLHEAFQYLLKRKALQVGSVLKFHIQLHILYYIYGMHLLKTCT